MAGLSGDVNIPHVGKLPKAAVVFGVGGVIVLVIWQKHKASAAAAAPAASGAAPGDPYPSDGTTGNPNDPYSLDPSTGVTYGDEAASGSGTGYGGYSAGYAGGGGYGISSGGAYPWDGTYSNPNDPYSMDPSTGQTYGNEGNTGGGSGGTGGPPFSTNAQWSQYVLNYFETQQFSDMAGMTAAIGSYLAGQPVDALQQGYINEATAIAGQPPVAGPGNYPPSIRLQGSAAGVTSPVPNAPQAYTSGGHVISRNSNDAVIGWTGHNAVRYTTVIQGPGKINGHRGQTTIPQASFSGLEAGHTYDVAVTPYNSAGKAGKTGVITLVTTR